MTIPDLNALRQNRSRATSNRTPPQQTVNPARDYRLVWDDRSWLVRIGAAAAALGIVLEGPARHVWGLKFTTTSGKWVLIFAVLALLLALVSVTKAALVALISIVLPVSEVNPAIGVWLAAGLVVGLIALRATIPERERSFVVFVVLWGCFLAPYGLGLAVLSLFVLDQRNSGWRRLWRRLVGAVITIVAEELAVLASAASQPQGGNPLRDLLAATKGVGPAVAMQLGARIGQDLFTGAALGLTACCVVAAWIGDAISGRVSVGGHAGATAPQRWLTHFTNRRYGVETVALLSTAAVLLLLVASTAGVIGGPEFVVKQLIAFVPAGFALAMCVATLLREEGVRS